jgi:hypothetical protein
MVDLDLKDFPKEMKNGQAILDRVLNKILHKIKESTGGNPTVLWTGNGYHVYQPVSGIILEEYDTFYEFTSASTQSYCKIMFGKNSGKPKLKVCCKRARCRD